MNNQNEETLSETIFKREGDFDKQERRVCSCGAFIKTHYLAFILNFEEAHRVCIGKE